MRQRGLRVWHDADQFGPGSQLTREAEQALNSLPGAVFLLTPTSISRPFIREVELERAGKRKRYDASFRLVFVLCDVDSAAAEATVLQYAGLHLRSQIYETVSLPSDLSPEEREDAIGTVCDRISRQFVDDILRAIPPQDRGICRLGLYTYADDVPSEADIFSFDWRSLFQSSVPSERIWSGRLQSALDRLVNVLCAHGVRDVRLHGSPHISAAIAFGYAFRPVRGLSVAVDQRGEYWAIDDRFDPDPEMTAVPIGGDGPFDAREWSVEVSISRDVSPAVDELVKRRALVARQRHRLQPSTAASRTSVRDAQHANAIAASVARAIAAIRLAQPDARTHLFVASPMAVAVCIGAHLNKCGQVQVHEYINELGDYCLSCCLGSV